MNLNVSLAQWVTANRENFPSLENLTVITMGESTDVSTPFLGILESGSTGYEQDGVPLHGVSTYEITCELHTVPSDEANDGTSAEDERIMRTDLYDIIGNRDAIEWVNGRNFWSVFDIRAGGPTTEAQEGRRVTRWILSVIAAPL